MTEKRSEGRGTMTIRKDYKTEYKIEQWADLREALEEIVAVASGERQVAVDDTEGMEWIDKRARQALAEAALRQQTPAVGEADWQPLTPEQIVAMEEFGKEMECNVIPKIVEAMHGRAKAAAQARKWFIAAQTEQEMHNAWRKRAEEAEASQPDTPPTPRERPPKGDFDVDGYNLPNLITKWKGMERMYATAMDLQKSRVSEELVASYRAKAEVCQDFLQDLFKLVTGRAAGQTSGDALALIEECGLALASEEICCNFKHVKTFDLLNKLREAALGQTSTAPLCRYRDSSGKECGTPIIADANSRSHYAHATGQGWLHWASPKVYGPQDSEAAFGRESRAEFNLRYGHEATCYFATNSGMCDCGRGFGRAASTAQGGGK